MSISLLNTSGNYKYIKENKEMLSITNSKYISLIYGEFVNSV